MVVEEDYLSLLFHQPKRKDRDEMLRLTVHKTLRRGGNVLIPVDTAGRCLEVAHYLEQCWQNQDSGLMPYGLAMLNHVSFNVADFSKSLIEWMSEKIVRTFEDQRVNPFHFRHMQMCHTLEQLDSVSDPKVVLASSEDLSHGFARQLFVDWADNDLNAIIFTSQENNFVPESSPNHGAFNQLVGLAQGNLEIGANLPKTSTGTLCLPLQVEQRVTGDAYTEAMSHSILRNTAIRSSNSNEDSNQLEEPVDSSLVLGEQDNNEVENNPNAMHVDVEEGTVDQNDTVTADTSVGLESINASTPEGSHRNVVRPIKIDTKPPLSTPTLPTPNHGGENVAGRAFQLTCGRHQPGYDIYPGLHNHTGGHFFRTAKRMQLLFPQREKIAQFDEYGQCLDNESILGASLPVNSTTKTTATLSDKKAQQQAKSHSNHDDSRDDAVSKALLAHYHYYAKKFDLEPDKSSSSTRCVVHNLEIPLRCELLFIDFSGRSDGEALKRIVIGLRPQEMILIGQNRKAVDHLAEYCRKMLLLDSGLIHTPGPLDVVDCTKEEDIYQAHMKDSLVTSLKFTKLRDYELAWIEASVALPSNELDNDGEGQQRSADQLPILTIPDTPIAPHATVFVNEPKLSDLKQLLLAEGLVAEFVSGVLVVDSCVAIKRSEAGKLVLEGLLSPTYFEVRRVLYQQFAIL